MARQIDTNSNVKSASQGITAKKSENFSEWFTQVTTNAQLVDIRYGVQGFIVYRPWAFKIMRKIYELLEAAVEEDNHEPILFPIVIPEENLTKEKEHAGFAPDVFWLTQAGNEKLDNKLALRPTSETAIYPMYSLWLRSFRELPYKFYQSRITVYRNEKQTRPFLRGREIPFFETHDAFRTHEEGLAQVNKDIEIMHEVFTNQLKIPFMIFRRPRWDKFLGAVDTFAPDTLTPDGKRLQIGTTHDLGQNFSKIYDVKFRDEDQTEKYVWQTCFGPGIIRLVAALISIHGDDKGLVLPPRLAPTQVVIVPVVFSADPSANDEVLDRCNELKSMIKSWGYAVVVDTSDESPGFKYNQWEMMGVPIRLEIGPKEVTADEVTLVRRTDKSKNKVKLADVRKEIEHHLTIIEKEMETRAQTYFKEKIKSAETLGEIKNLLETHRGFIKSPWCSVDQDGAGCAEILKEATSGGSVSGVSMDDPDEKPSLRAVCPICGKQATAVVYLCKSY